MPTKTSLVRFSTRSTTHATYSDWTGTAYDNNYVTWSGQEYLNTRTGVSLPKYRSIIKSGGDATTVMSGTKVALLAEKPVGGSALVLPAGQQWVKYREDALVIYMKLMGGHVFGTSLASADSLALIQALKRVEQQRNQFQGLTALGELGETIKMLKHPFQSARTYLDKHFKNLAKAQKGSANRGSSKKQQKSFLTTAADSWLEVAFGIKPLISDVKSAAEAVARYEFDSRRTFVTGYGEDVKVSDSDTWGQAPSCNYLALFERTRMRTVQSVRYKVAMDYSRSADFGSTRRLLELNGLTVEQFVPTLWELVPWSFLVDYFTNIGDVISAGCTSQDSVKYAVRTERLQTTQDTQFTLGPSFWGPAPGVIYSSSDPGRLVLTRTSVARSSSAKLATPSVQFSLPGKVGQYANMLALWKSNERSLLSRYKR